MFTAEVVRAEVYKAGGRRVGVGYTGLRERIARSKKYEV